MTNRDHSTSYSDNAFWSKTARYAKKAGVAVLDPALKMYYALQDSDTPTWAKATITGALGYFIFPVDLIPDLMPVVGYSDDLAVLAGAIGAVATHIKDEHKALAVQKLKQWFGDDIAS